MMRTIRLNMTIDPHIFRAYDIRGDVRTQLTPEVVDTIGRALAISHFYPGARLVVGRDARTHSPELAGKLIFGLNIHGVNVWDLGQVTTPMLYYALFTQKCDGGVMVTGSHNPINDNGLKICRGTESFVRADIEAVREIAMGDIWSFGPAETRCGEVERNVQRGTSSRLDIAASYINEILSSVEPGRKLKIVIDAGNGVAGPYAKSLFAHYASDLTCLYCDPDGTFPNHHPDPSVAKNLADLQKKVLEMHADIGLAFDGDGDRLGVIDHNGNIIAADKLVILFAREILARTPNQTILADVKCSKLTFDDIAQKHGHPQMTKTGHALIKAALRETGAAFAGEMSGHFFFKDRWFGFDDALYAGARIVEIAAKALDSGQTLADLLNDLPETCATPEIRIDCPDDLKFDLATAMCAKYKNLYPTCDLDGARIDFPNGWALIRASNTQPALVMRVEADSQAHVDEIMRDISCSMHDFVQQRGAKIDLTIR